MITYTTGNINQPDAGSVGIVMVNQLRDDLVAHPAWDLVEEFTPAAGVVRWMVFKCLATESGLPADFFVVVGRVLGSGKLNVAVCEEYNAATHTMSFFSPSTASTLFLYDALGRRSETYVLGTTEFAGASVIPVYTSWLPSGVSTKWWISVVEDGFTAGFNGASNGWLGAGAYTPLTVLPIDFPILSMGSSGNWGTTRNPAVAGINQRGYALAVDTNLVQLGFAGRFDVNDLLQNNQRVVSEIGIRVSSSYSGLGSDPATWGNVLGKLRNVRMGAGNHPAGFAFGDAYALNGTLWVPYLSSDTKIWDTGVAAA